MSSNFLDIWAQKGFSMRFQKILILNTSLKKIFFQQHLTDRENQNFNQKIGINIQLNSICRVISWIFGLKNVFLCDFKKS